MAFDLIGFLDGSNIPGSQQYNVDVGEKTTVRLYAYINRYARTLLIKAATKNAMRLGTAQWCYIGSRIKWVESVSPTLQAGGRSAAGVEPQAQKHRDSSTVQPCDPAVRVVNCTVIL